MNNNPIGVFDSGLGGLTVVKAIQDLLPNESVIYLGDTARLPYGNKSQQTIKKYSFQIADFLIENGAKIIVIACNTASALAIVDVKKYVEIPVVGVIEPGVETAINSTRNKQIGVIGTTATIRSMEYEKKLKTADPVVNVVSQSCPLFVPLVEEGWLDGTIAEDIAKIYLKPITSANIDTLVLGCTHYPLLKPLLQSQIGNEIKIIDSAYPVANKIDKLITSTEIQTEKNSKGDLSCFTTDILSQFESIAERFLDNPVTTVSTVTLGIKHIYYFLKTNCLCIMAISAKNTQ